MEQEVDVSSGQLESLNLAELVAWKSRYDPPERGECLVEALRSLTFTDIRHCSLILSLLVALAVLATYLGPCRGGCRHSLALRLVVAGAAELPLLPDSRPAVRDTVVSRRRRRRLRHVTEFRGLLAVPLDMIDHIHLGLELDFRLVFHHRYSIHGMVGLALDRLDGAGSDHFLGATAAGRIHVMVMMVPRVFRIFIDNVRKTVAGRDLMMIIGRQKVTMLLRRWAAEVHQMRRGRRETLVTCHRRVTGRIAAVAAVRRDAGVVIATVTEHVIIGLDRYALGRLL